MDLRQMEYFLAVAQETQFTRAAEIAHVSQSGLSAAIKKLEDELKTKLFTRSTRKVELTAAGHALLPYASSLLSEADAARDAVTATIGHLAGSLRIGSEQCLGRINVTGALERFHRRHDQVDITFTQSGSAHLLDQLRAGELDIAIVAGAPTSAKHRSVLANLDHNTLNTERLVVLSPPNDQLEAQKAVAWDDIHHRRFVDFDTSWAIRILNDELADAHKLQRRVCFTVSDVHALLDMINRGLGIAIVPQSIAQKSQAKDLTKSTLITEPALTWTVSAVLSPRDGSSGAAAELLSLLEFRA